MAIPNLTKTRCRNQRLQIAETVCRGSGPSLLEVRNPNGLISRIHFDGVNCNSCWIVQAVAGKTSSWATIAKLLTERPAVTATPRVGDEPAESWRAQPQALASVCIQGFFRPCERASPKLKCEAKVSVEHHFVLPAIAGFADVIAVPLILQSVVCHRYGLPRF